MSLSVPSSNQVAKFLTPARLTAAIGVVTGLAAAATSALNVIPAETSGYRAVQTLVGVAAVGATVFKFLAGQSAWEVANVAAASAERQQAAAFGPWPVNGTPLQPPVESNTAELPDEEPIVETPEPERLADQSTPASS